MSQSVIFTQYTVREGNFDAIPGAPEPVVLPFRLYGTKRKDDVVNMYSYKGYGKIIKIDTSFRFSIILWIRFRRPFQGGILIRGMIYFCTITHSLDVKIFINDKNIHQQNDSIENKLYVIPHKITTVTGVEDPA